MSKTEKVFWGVLLFLAGAAVGALAYAILAPPKQKVECNETGRSTQVENEVEYKTYIPALDKCK